MNHVLADNRGGKARIRVFYLKGREIQITRDNAGVLYVRKPHVDPEFFPVHALLDYRDWRARQLGFICHRIAAGEQAGYLWKE